MDITNLSILLDSNLEKKRKFSKIKTIDIPDFFDYKTFKTNNYTVPVLKSICKKYNLKVSGNKIEIQERIYNYLLNFDSAKIIQKYFRRYLVITYYNIIGPGFKDRSVCTNDSDFFTLESLNEIDDSQFFSFKDNNNIWGFNILSIYNLFVKNKTKDVLNPYTREVINNKIFYSIKQFIRISYLFNKNINILINNDDTCISLKKRNEIKCLELFQIINEMGNYSDYRWFLNLDRLALLKFIRELADIWDYRAELSNEKKCQICSPYGNPFRYCDIRRINANNLLQLQKIALTIINQLVNKGINRDFSNLGAYYVLGALTLVNEHAATALPWLFQSVS